MKRQLTITVDADVVKQAKMAKQKSGRSLSHVCETALREWAKDYVAEERKANEKRT